MIDRRPRLLMAAVATVLVLHPASLSALGPGFACNRASSADERAICRSAELSALDRQMTRLYREIQSCTAMGGHGANIDDQRDWLAKRAVCGSDRQCLRRLYRQRIEAFAPHATKARRFRALGECPNSL